MSTPKISIIVPVYNVEKYVKRCIASIQSQSVEDIEIIIVNDCSPDNSKAIVDEMAKYDDRIRVLSHKSNKGLMWARRTGYMAAQGEYITFCDSDDTLPEDALESLYSEAIRSKADIVSGNIRYIKASGEEFVFQSHLRYGYHKQDAIKSLLRGELYHNLCSKLFKSSLLKDNNYKTFSGFTNGEDGCLFYQVINNIDTIAQIDVTVYNYFQNKSSSSQIRLNDCAINCICLANKIMYDTASLFPELYDDRNLRLTKNLCYWYADGYDIDTRFSQYLRVYGLIDYISYSSIIRYCSFYQLLKVLAKRVLLNIRHKRLS